MAIINNTDYTFSTQEQQTINNGMAYAGIDVVYTQRESTKLEDANLFHFYEDGDFSNYAFSIDIDAGGDCILWNRN